MPEMKNSFQKGRMNKDLDERMVPNGEYRDALNVEVSTSEGSDVGTLQTLKGTRLLSFLGEGQKCIGSIVDHRNDKIYWMVWSDQKNMIVEYDYISESVIPVCVDMYASKGTNALGFDPSWLITGINIIDGILFWTDNNTEPKRIDIERGILGSNGFSTHTNFLVRDVSTGASPTAFPLSVGDIREEHLTVIKKGPPTAPVLEMVDSNVGDIDNDGLTGGSELESSVVNSTGTFIDGDGEWLDEIIVSTPSTMDYSSGDYVSIYQTAIPVNAVRGQISNITTTAGSSIITIKILSGVKEIEGETGLMIKLEQNQSLFTFKFPRFAYRYKYEDGEYSPFSPFSQPAFLPGRFDYVPKEGYNVGMVNRVRKLVIKDFVHTRSLPDDVISIDILYKESNSPNIYSVKTIKKRDYNPLKWDEWNGTSVNTVGDGGFALEGGSAGLTKGFMPITTEMIHAVLPSNQLLRPWDNVPRKALAQELVGNRLVYGNYLQNYNLTNSATNESNIKVDLKVQLSSSSVGSQLPEEVQAGPNMYPKRYGPAKSIKSLRTYQIGITYLDEYGRETPVLSEDKRGTVIGTGTGSVSQASIYVEQEVANQRNSIIVEAKNNPPDWATHMKFFVKETSNEYYNLAMDRWYDAEDGNVWLSFPSAERNKVDEETFLILKKQHDTTTFVSGPSTYKIIAIENEAPRFIKLQDISMGGVTDGLFTGSTSSVSDIIGLGTDGFPLEGTFYIKIEKQAFDDAGWKESLVNQDISQVYVRVKSAADISLWYRLKQISYDNQGAGYYKLESDKLFGPDMSHTSPDATHLNRDQTCQVQIIKRIPEDRAEFEGRFFVKILKDGELIKNLHILEGGPEINYATVSSMQVQYINPLAATWDGWNTNRWKISIDSRQGDGWANPGGGYDNGDGQTFWKKAGKVEGAGSSSSGWFIDAVEGFRPYKGKVRPTVSSGKSSGWRQKPHDTVALNACWGPLIGLDGDFGNNDWLWANAKGLNNYNQGGTNYLGTAEPLASPGSTMQDAPAGDGGQVAKTVNIGPNGGIDPVTGIIQLSYSGIGVDETVTNIGMTTWDDYAFAMTASKHAADTAFITKLAQPGTIWRWKEDPGKVLYKTVATNGLTSSSTPYTQQQFQTEQLDGMDAQKGVGLWNYVSFVDYPIRENHRHYFNYSMSGRWWSCSATRDNKKVDWISRAIPNKTTTWNNTCVTSHAWMLADWAFNHAECSIWKHPSYPGARAWGALANYAISPTINGHYSFPAGAQDWDRIQNKRRRFVFSAEALNEVDGSGVALKPGNVAPHYYLPTNDCTLPGHFNSAAEPITQHPNITGPAGVFDASQIAPGIRPDGMYTGHLLPGSNYSWDPDGSGVQSYDLIPQYKRWDATASGNKLESEIPGSVTWEIVEQFDEDTDKFTSTNPAIWETEPKEDVGLDIYHEVGQIYPIYLNNKTIEQFVGAVSENVTRNSFIQCWDPAPPTGSGLGTIALSTGTSQDIRVVAAKDDKVMLADTSGVYLDNNNPNHVTPQTGSYLMFWRADGSVTEAHVGTSINTLSNGTWYQLVGRSGEVGVHNKMVTLPWFNCYAFGNGVESDRIRDDFNQVTIDNGPKASTTLEEPYIEDRRKNGFIWSGIYNSTSGVNNLNQFIQAEAITKDINPSYGSIQKMFVRDSDLVAYCEDRVLKVYANKDALFNADGNTNVVATNKVLGAVKPFVGDYGISKNPESFASDSYRSYFADTSRGAVLRLSMDGITPISDAGMKDWFADIMPMYATKTGSSIVGSFDDKKEEYNITFRDNPYDKDGQPRLTPPSLPPVYVPGIGNPPGPPAPVNLTQGARLSAPPSGGAYATTNAAQISALAQVYTFAQLAPTQQSTTINPIPSLREFDDKVIPETTVSFSEPSKAWVSFKSWIQEGGVSLNNSYYTFSGGQLHRHHDNELRNNFYGVQYDSSVHVLFNQGPSIIKSFNTLNYEGTQSRVTQDIINNPDYYDNIGKTGWYVNSLISNAQEVGELEFWDKEDKWFSQIKGTATKWLNDGTAGNIDPREFSYQGIGNAGEISCPDCKEATSWECQDGTCMEGPGSNRGYSTEQECIDSSCGQSAESWTCGNGELGCIDPGDGTGQYATECDCAENCCGSSVIRFFDCQNLSQPNYLIPGCMDNGVTQDSWIIANRPATWVGPASNYNNDANYDDCNCVYSTSSSWDCNGQGTCVELFDGTGAYATFNICDINCNIPCPTNQWNLSANSTPTTSNSGGGCAKGTSNSDGTISISNLPVAVSNWSASLEIMGVNGIYGTVGYQVSNAGAVQFTGLDDGSYRYTITDLDTTCSFIYTISVACVDPLATYNCQFIEYGAPIACNDPGDGTGYYSGATAYNDCMNDPNSLCNPPPPTVSWDCTYNYTSHEYNCVDPGDGSGPYTTQALCLADPFSECSVPVGPVEGCTDECACNHDPLANIDIGSCYYPCDTLIDLPLSEMDYLNSNSPACLADPNCSGLIGSAYTVAVGAHQNPVGDPINPGSYAWHWQTEGEYPNNENVWNTINVSPNLGVWYDVRQLRFEVGYGPSGFRNNLSIRHINLDGFYGQKTTFFRWGDYIDAAVATGLTGMTQLINLGMAGQPGYDMGGYMTDLSITNTIINSAFVTDSWYAPGDTDTPCNSSQYTSADCDRTSSKFCTACTPTELATIASYGTCPPPVGIL